MKCVYYIGYKEFFYNAPLQKEFGNKAKVEKEGCMTTSNFFFMCKVHA